MSLLPVLLLAAGLCAGSPVHSLRFRKAVDVDGAVARLSDVADLSGLAAGLRRQAGDLVLMGAHRQMTEVAVPVRAIVARLRAIAPALGCAVTGEPAGTIRINFRSRADEARLPPPPPRAEIAAGKPLVLVAAVGPVRVARTVTTLQPAKAGQRLFVRTAEGELISARFAGVGQ